MVQRSEESASCETSIFKQVMSSLTVMSICASLGPEIYEGTPLSELENDFNLGGHPDFDPICEPFCVIDSNGNPVGLLWFNDYALWEEEEDPEVFFVKDVMTRPAPWQFLSSSTTILEAVHLIIKVSSEPFYVIHRDQMVGYLRYRHLFHPVGRLAFLALALEIEDQALRLCQHPLFRETAGQSLSDSRRGKAIDIFKRRHARDPKPSTDIDKLIDCTQLADKATIIWKMKLISSISSRSRLLNFFDNLREIRDFCAHPQRSSSGDELVPKQKLSELIVEAKSMRNTLDETLFNHKVRKHHQRPGINV